MRNLCPRTQKSYWWHIQDYRTFIGKEPETTGIKELHSYFQSILSDGLHKPGSVKMGYFALRFLFVSVYHKDWAKEYLPTPKVAKTLPLVLSKEEVFSVIKNLKHRTIIMFIYSTGTRISECVNIKLTYIDSRRMQELLGVGYCHLIFTIPHELVGLCLQNKKVMYDILFKASSQTVLELSVDVKHLGADTGLITVLHTWGQNLLEHPHLHCIMPAGGL